MMKGQKNVKLGSWMILVVLTIVWGSSFILIKRGLEDPQGNPIFSPEQVGALRIFLAGLTLFPIAILQFKKILKKHHFWLFIVGLIGNTIPAFLFAIAETKVESAIAGMLNGTTPIFAFIISVIIFKVNFSRLNILGIAIGFIGTVGLVYFGAARDWSSLNYMLLLVFATICYGASVNMMKMKLKEVKPITITAVSLGYMAIPCLIYLSTTNFVEVMTTNENANMAFLYVVILSVVGTTAALVLFNYLVKRESVLFASSVTYLIPIVAILWGIWDGEELYGLQIAMILVILAGVFLVNKKEKTVLEEKVN